MDNKKLCNSCKQWKPLEEFVKAVNTTTGKASKCKECINGSRVERWKNDPEFKKRHLKQNKKSRLKLRYGLSVEDYEGLILQQGNKCKICNVEFDNNDKNKAARVDHNHQTEKVRSLLCVTCNVGLGYFKDNHELLFKASQYLKDHE